jgi:FtsH-binding integral membrane protein
MHATSGSRLMKDLDAWVGNSLALILSVLAIANGAIGMLVAFSYVNENATNPFQDGIVWLVAGLILAVTANAFRREHHVIDPDERRDVPMR